VKPSPYAPCAMLFLAFLLLGGCAAPAAVPAKEAIVSKDAPAAIGPYSQGIKMGNMLFLAGQVGADPRTGQLAAGGIEAQVRQSMDNIKAVLAANGMTMDDMVSTTVFLKDLEDFSKMNAVYGSYFKDKPPARATVQVARLPRDALVEVSSIAAK
jgi:2-iminobutanoate/2-iminopropanoate deaminase